jgi:hypothetical protein
VGEGGGRLVRGAQGEQGYQSLVQGSLFQFTLVRDPGHAMRSRVCGAQGMYGNSDGYDSLVVETIARTA